MSMGSFPQQESKFVDVKFNNFSNVSMLVQGVLSMYLNLDLFASFCLLYIKTVLCQLADLLFLEFVSKTSVPKNEQLVMSSALFSGFPEVFVPCVFSVQCPQITDFLTNFVSGF